MSVYKVCLNLIHDGAAFVKGEKIDLDDEVAEKQLLEDGVIDFIDEEEEARVTAKPMTPEEKKAKQDAEGGVKGPFDKKPEEVEAGEESEETEEEEDVEEEPVEEKPKKTAKPVAKKAAKGGKSKKSAADNL